MFHRHSPFVPCRQLAGRRPQPPDGGQPAPLPRQRTRPPPGPGTTALTRHAGQIVRELSRKAACTLSRGGGQARYRIP